MPIGVDGSLVQWTHVIVGLVLRLGEEDGSLLGWNDGIELVLRLGDDDGSLLGWKDGIELGDFVGALVVIQRALPSSDSITHACCGPQHGTRISPPIFSFIQEWPSETHWVGADDGFED